jgi:uncharacterized protein (DUF302 family)
VPHPMLSPVTCAMPGKAVAGFQNVLLVDAPFVDTVWRLREAIEAADFWILQEINYQLHLKRGGNEVAPMRLLLFFHPRFARRILEADSAALLETPLKIAILELPAGPVQVRWADPTAAFARYNNAALNDLGRELGAVCDEIANATLLRNGPPSV